MRYGNSEERSEGVRRIEGKPGAMPMLNLRMYNGFEWSLFRADGKDEAMKGVE